MSTPYNTAPLRVRRLDEDERGPGACCESGRHRGDVLPAYRLDFGGGHTLALCAACYDAGWTLRYQQP